MSTQIVTPAPSPELTINNSVAELKAAMDAAAAAPPVEPPPAPEPTPSAPVVAAPAPESKPYTVTETAEGVEIKLNSGTVYRGKTWQDATAELLRGKAEADATIERFKAQQVAAPVVEPAAPAPTEAEQERIKAQNWVLEQQAAAFGLTVDQYKEAVKQVFTNSQKSAEAVAWSDFTQSCPDYADTPQNAEALVDYLPTEVISRQRQPTVQDLKTAHAMALYEKKYAPAATATQVSARAIPPVMLSSGVSQTAPDADPYKMPLNDLKKAAFGQ